MANPDQPTVSVGAQAQREVVPDEFTVSASVSARGATSQQATAALVAGFTALEDAVAGLPVSVERRRGGVSSWAGGGKGRGGWHAQRSLSLRGGGDRTHDGADIGALVGAVVAAVAAVPDVEIQGPEWSVSRGNAVHEELQADVVAEAVARARRYAAALGATLGRLVSLSDPGSDRGVVGLGYGRQMHAVMASGTPSLDDLDLTAPTATVSAAVTGTWRIVLPD